MPNEPKKTCKDGERRMSIGKHQTRNKNTKYEWLTPRFVTDALGPFDLDPCSPVNRPWPIAFEHMTIHDDGLWQPWLKSQFVWMNPPYGNHTGDWLEKLSEHGNGIALVFARTETEMFFDHVWNHADCIFFFSGRLTFFHVDGTEGSDNGGAPSVLIGYGSLACEQISKAQSTGKIKGKLINLKVAK